MQLSREQVQLGIEKQQGATSMKSIHGSLKVISKRITGQIVREVQEVMGRS